MSRSLSILFVISAFFSCASVCEIPTMLDVLADNIFSSFHPISLIPSLLDHGSVDDQAPSDS